MSERHDTSGCLTLQRQVAAGDPLTAVEFLAHHSGLSKGRLKDAMNKGAVWLRSGRSGRKRLRRATAQLSLGDELELYYDPALLALVPPPLQCLADKRDYTVWYKPAGVLAQGTDYGDHCSLMRLVELQLKRPVFLIHRLDREAQGIMLLAHRQHTAAQLSQLFQQTRVDKVYRVMVRGNVTATHGLSGRIELALDDKPASTEYLVQDYDTTCDCSTVQVRLHSGRLHQIRRHFDAIGHPVLGDPRYGRDNKDAAGLRLVAVELGFVEPGTRQRVHYAVPPDLLPF